MLTDKVEPIISNGVATIGGNNLIHKEIVTVSWSWNDDEVQLHIKRLNNSLHFTDSPVNILSATALADPLRTMRE